MAAAGGAGLLGLARSLAALGIGSFATHLCTVETPTLTDDGHAGKEKTWEAAPGLKRLPCVAYPNSARAGLVGDVPASKTVYSVLVQGKAAVTSKMRVVLHATDAEPERVLEIKSVLPSMGVVVEIVGLVSI